MSENFTSTDPAAADEASALRRLIAYAEKELRALGIEDGAHLVATAAAVVDDAEALARGPAGAPGRAALDPSQATDTGKIGLFDLWEMIAER